MTTAVATGGTLMFDGDCGFCSRWVDWARARVSAEVTFAPGVAFDLESVGLTPEDIAAAAWWITPDGRLRRGSAAIAAVLRECPGAWSRVGRALEVPPVSWCATAVYAIVARHRSRLPGGSPSCGLPRP